MVIPVHVRGLLDLLKVLLNPRLLMVWALAAGAASQTLRQGKSKRSREERRREAEELRRRVARSLEAEASEGTDDAGEEEESHAAD